MLSLQSLGLLMALLKFFKKKLKDCFPNLNGSTPVCVACSGGVDSMVLLDLTRQTFSPVQICYVDHKQRKDTHLEKEIISTYAKNHALVFHRLEIPLKPNASEAWMRKMRYEALIQLAKSQNTVVFTAHHADDNLETYLFKLLRGTHPQTLKGISEQVEMFGVRFYRPLLGFMKQELTQWAIQNQIPWYEDQTNVSQKYARNQIRKNLIPHLENFRPGARRRLLSFFSELEKLHANTVLEDYSQELQSKEGLKINNIEFFSLKNTLDIFLGELSHSTKKSHWENVKRQLGLRKIQKLPLKKLQFPGGSILRFQGNALFWDKTL